MKGFAAVFGREIQDRRLLLVAGALAGLIPFVTPLLTAYGGQAASTTRFQVALAISLVAGAVLALLLGATVVAGDLAERRLGFYFSRPLPAWSIWAGKMGAAVALTLLTSGLVLLPTLLFGGAPRSELADLNGGTLAAALAGLGGVIALVSCSHAVSVILRQRSAWVVLDLVAASLVAGALWAIRSSFLAWWAVDTSQRVLLGFAGFAAAVAVVAGAVQVAAGRVDGRRAHRCLSLSLWSGLLAGILLLSGYTWWFLHPAPEDLGDFAPPVSDPTGRWLALAGNPRGRAADYWLTFVLDGRTGRFYREPLPLFGLFPRFSPPVAFSTDGGTAVWGKAQPRTAAGSREPYTLVRFDLAHPAASPVETQVAVADPSFVALSPHGDRVATRQRNRLLVHDLATGRLLASSVLPLSSEPLFRMPDDRRVLLLNFTQDWTSQPLQFPLLPRRLTLDLRELCCLPAPDADGPHNGVSSESISVRPVSSLTIDGRVQVSLNATWTRLLARAGSRVHLYDLRRGGAPVADLSTAGAPGAETAAYFLRDGRIAWLVSGPAGRELRMLDANGVQSGPSPAVRFDGPGGISLVGETAAGRIVLQVSAPRSDRQLVLVDLARGTTSRLPRGLTPMQPLASWVNPQLPRATLYSRHGDMIWFDPDTNRERLLVHLTSDRTGAAR